MNPAIWHGVYLLADFPVLAALAYKRTEAIKLDGRACHAIYIEAMDRLDWQDMPASELAFMKSLGIERLVLVIDLEANLS